MVLRHHRPVGGAPARADEPRWPASLAILAALVLYITLPDNLVFGPKWLLPSLELALLVALTIASPRRHHEEGPKIRRASIALIALVNVANVTSLALLVEHLLRGGKAGGTQLILAALLIWSTNVLIFGLWYWELDRGGPGGRTQPQPRPPDFLFPQMSNPNLALPHWRPNFVDYLYVSLTNATAFSPTDTMPLTPMAKGLMAIQSLASLITVALVAARAVNILS
ncbi:MAG: hypothetical protein C4343_01920 [Chloroflexota bacterium]